MITTMTLRTLGEALVEVGIDVRLPDGDGPTIRGITEDSRTVGPDMLFCALRGTVGDGHDHIVGAIEAETDPVIVMGDLNVVDRSSGYRAFTDVLDDGMRQSGWAVPTADRGLPWNLLFARIDHLLIDGRLCATDGASEDTRFADHRPLVATVGVCTEN